MRLVTLVAIVAALAASACGGTGGSVDPSAQLVVEMRDYAVKPNLAAVKAGTIKIGVRNLAAMQHQLVVIKTDLAPDKLPYDGGRAQAVETGLVGKVDVDGQKAAALTVTLVPGSYVLICNVPGHYQLGMRAALTVEP